jgi:hypothetical protein
VSSTNLVHCLAVLNVLCILCAPPCRAESSTSPASSRPTQNAAALPARDTAFVWPSAGHYSVGVFNPLTVSVGSDVELQAHPLLFFVAPHLLVRVAHVPLVDECGSWGLTGEYGWSVPTPAMRLTQGTLFPAWEQGGGQIGWSVTPHAGAVASWRGGSPWATNSVLTSRLDLSVGVPLTASDAQPLDAPAPLNLLFAPILNGYRGRMGVEWDLSLQRRWRLKLYGDLFVHGTQSELEWPQGAENLTSRLGAGLDVGFGQTQNRRLTFGVAWWNSEQHAIDPDTWQPLRSNDVWPTLDFIWGG